MFIDTTTSDARASACACLLLNKMRTRCFVGQSFAPAISSTFSGSGVRMGASNLIINRRLGWGCKNQGGCVCVERTDYRVA